MSRHSEPSPSNALPSPIEPAIHLIKTPRFTGMRQLLRLARPQFLFASLVLYSMGGLWAVLLGGSFSPWRMLLGYLAIMPAHLSISFSNDYFDVAVDSLSRPSIFSGGSGVLVRHPELRKTARWIAMALIGLSLAFALLITLFLAFPFGFLLIILAGNLVGWYYSAPPLRLSYRGWGEISTAIIAGLLPITGYLVIRGRLDLDGLLLIPALFLYGLAFILIVQIPDEETDRLGSKKTWVAQMGANFGFAAVAAFFLASTAYFFYLAWYAPRPLPVNASVLGTLSLIPLSAAGMGIIAGLAGKQVTTRLANFMAFTLAVFLLLMDGYFVLLAF